MSYPGNSSLSVQAQERVMTAFKQVLNNLQAGQREEASIGLEFVLRLDPSFTPATNLKRQLTSSSKEIDLGDIIAQLQAPTTEAINTLLIEAVDDFNSREFIAAKEKVEKVLIDLPGHQEARDLRDQIDKALKIEGQVGQFLIQAREALANDDPQEAANFVMMAQALDPHHTGIATTLKEIDAIGGAAVTQQISTAPADEDRGDEPGPPAGSEPPAAAEPDRGDAVGAASESETGDEAFAVDFDSNDPFADIIEGEPDASDTAAPPIFGGGEDVAFPAMDDTADLFAAPDDHGAVERPSDGPPATGAGAGDGHGDVGATIQGFIEAGQDALAAGDLAQAISTWSRIFLIKPEHPEATHLIEKAKRQFAEASAKVEELSGKARDAFDEGEYEAAQLLVNKALGIQPNHLGVNMLREELDRELGGRSATPSAVSDEAPAQPTDEPPELDDDLFGDPTAAEAAAEAPIDGEAPSVDSVADTLFDDDLDLGDLDDFGDMSLVERLRSRLPLRLVGLLGVALVVVLVGVWLGGRLLSSEPEVDDATRISEVLVQAERLYKQNKVEEALHLLREFPAAGLGQKRIDMRIAKYEESLAPPTPTPTPEEATRAESLLDQGLWWAAYESAADGLKTYPDDPGLLSIRQQVEEIEPEAAVLEHTLDRADYRTAVSIAEDLLAQYEGQGDLKVVYERCLFNAALAESRAYNLTGAEKHLLQLLEIKPQDEEAVRFLEFVQKYKVRAADMRLEIFIRSMDER